MFVGTLSFRTEKGPKEFGELLKGSETGADLFKKGQIRGKSQKGSLRGPF